MIEQRIFDSRQPSAGEFEWGLSGGADKNKVF